MRAYYNIMVTQFMLTVATLTSTMVFMTSILTLSYFTGQHCTYHDHLSSDRREHYPCDYASPASPRCLDLLLLQLDFTWMYFDSLVLLQLTVGYQMVSLLSSGQISHSATGCFCLSVMHIFGFNSHFCYKGPSWSYCGRRRCMFDDLDLTILVHSTKVGCLFPS